MNFIADETPDELRAVLARSKAEIEAGQSVPLEPFLDRLRTSITRMKARRAEHDPNTAHKV